MNIVCNDASPHRKVFIDITIIMQNYELTHPEQYNKKQIYHFILFSLFIFIYNIIIY